jgi:ligand-binding sensor domain-containing protein
MKPIVSFCLHFLLFFYLCPQVYSQEFNLVNIGVDQGMITTEVHDIDQDKDGFMWFATDIGVFKYDGNSFIYYTSKNGLSHTVVFDIFLDINDRMWFNTYKGGICYFDNDTIKDYSFNDILLDLIDSVGVSDSHIDDFIFEENELWFTLTKSRGLYKIDNTGEIKYFSFNKKKATLFSKPTHSGSLSGFINNNYFTNTNLISHDFDFNYYSIVEGQQSAISKVGVDSDYIFIDNRILKQEEDKILSRIIDYKILSIKTDNQNNLWIGTINGGLVFCPSGDFLEQKLESYLTGLTITDIFQDKQDNLWIATLEKGIFLIKTLNTKSYKLINENINSKISTLDANDNTILFGTVDGSVYSIINNSFQQVSGEKISGDVKDILIINNSEALINGEKINFTSKSNLITKESIYSGMKIFTSNNDIIACGFFGFKIIKNDNIIYDSKTKILAINDEKIKDMCFLNDTLWILTTTKVYNFYDKKVTEKKFSEIDALEITSLSNFKDSLLVICTRNDGVYLKKKTKLKNISKSEGLNSNICYSLFCSDEKIYVGTNNGLNIIEFDKNNKQRIRFIDKTNYLNSNMIYDIALHDNKIVLATNLGIDIIEDYKKPFEFNSTYIYPIIVNNQQYFSSDNTYNLKSSQNNIQISFVTPFYGEDNQIRYRYKLSDADTIWKITSNTTIQFPNLSSGNYRFVVQPFYNNIYGEEAFINLNIRPYFTQTWWFRVIIFLILMWIVYIIYRNKLHKKETEKELILSKQKALKSQMNPHFIFNSLNSIQNFILKNQQDLSIKYLSRFSKLIRNILDNSERTYITISEDIEALTHYIELEKVRFKNRFNYSFEVDKNLDTNYYCIPPLLIQPYVENAIWHGLMHKQEGGSIFISYEMVDEKIICTIKDDGVGRKKACELEKSSVHTSKGTLITNERISILAKSHNIEIKCEIIDLYDKNKEACGTKIEFYIPLITEN